MTDKTFSEMEVERIIAQRNMLESLGHAIALMQARNDPPVLVNPLINLFNSITEQAKQTEQEAKPEHEGSDAE